MEKIVEELKKIFPFKDSTQVGDIVLIVADEPQTMLYALVTDIERDRTKREEWWHVTLQVLSIPPQKVIWILRTPQFTGKEIFTMGGEKRFIKAINFAKPKEKPQKPKGKKPSLRIVK